MTPYTETDKGAKAENYGKTESSWTEEILVAETATSLTKEEKGKVESRREISTMIQCMKACRRFRACCKCQGCLNRKQEKRSKRSTEEIVGSIANKIKQINWPDAIGESKLAFVQITNTTRKRDKPKGYLAWTLLKDCQVKLAAEAEQDGEIVVLKDARQFIFGFKPANEDCKFKAGTEIKLVTGVEQVRRVHRRNHKGQKMINCTKAETVPWIMQDTTWNLMAVDPWTKEWSERMEELTNEAQELRGMQLEWQREGIKKVVTLENIMCPVTNHLTESLKESIESFEAQKLERKEDQNMPSLVPDDFSDHDEEDEEDAQGIVHFDEGGHSVMAVEDWEKFTEKDKIRLLMWNPENLAQRLNLGGTTDRGKKIRMNSPPLRSVKKEWIEQILAVNPQFIIYNEASLPGSDTQKRKNHKVIIKEAEEFHESMKYRLIVGFEGKGHASHGGAIAVKLGTVITDIQYSFTGGREKQGRVLCVRVETETDETTGANGIWIVQMYMHNSGAKKRESMMKAYGMWAETHGEPVIIGSDTNSIDDMKQDVEMHVHKNSAMRKSGNFVSLKDTLNMKTGEAIPDSGLEKAEIFLGTRRDGMQEFYVRNKLFDARGDDVGTLAHTCHFAWMRWHQYAKKNKGRIGTGQYQGKEIIYAGMPPCITARIDRFLLTIGAFKVTKMEVFNDLADENKRNEYAQAEASNLSDHYAMALEVRPQASLKKGVTQVVINVMRDIKRTPEEEVRYTACEVEEEVVEPSPREQEVEAQAAKDRELQRIEETGESKMPDKWSRVTRKAMEMKVTLKRLANAIPVTETDDLHQEVIDILREAGWLEQEEPNNCDEGEELPRRFDESGEELPELERICAPRGFAHTTEGMKLLDKVLEAATFIRLWKQQNADKGSIESDEKSRKVLQGVTTDTKKRQNEKSELVHEKINKLMASKTQTAQVRKWRTYVADRTFRAASALHYLNCAYSDNNNTHVLLRTRTKQDDKEASSRTLVTNVIKCIQNRRMRQATQVSDESALSEIARDSTEGVLGEITEMMQEGQLEDIREFLMQGMKSQNEGEVALTEDTSMISNFRRVPECFTRTPDNIGMHEVKIAQEVREEDREQRLSVALRNAIMAKTNPRRTTRIRGQVAMGEWSRVIGKRHEEGKRMGELIEMSEENCQFDRAEHEDDMLIDTGCSYTIVSKEWLGEYCTKNKLDVRSVLIAYPKDYEQPVASTASEGTMVKGIGFARVKLRIVTLPTGYDLEWSEDGIRSGAGTSVMEIDTYVHVFEHMASAWLLGMPFIQEFTAGWDMEAKQVILKDNKGIKGAVPLHSKEEVPLRPVMVCTKEDIRLQPQCEADVQGYTIGTSNFPSQAEFHVMDEQGNGKWAEEGQISEGTIEKVQLEYGIEPIQDFNRLHSGSGFVAYGVEGRNMLFGGQLHSPRVRICSIENEVIDIPAGTPVGIIVQKCQGIPTYEWGRDYKFTKVPSKLEKKDRKQTRAIPSAEIQKACEYPAAKLLEGVIQDVTTQAETGERGAEQDETIKDIMACHRIQEELERLRDSCGVKTSNLTPQEKMSVHQMEKAEARKPRPSSASHFGYGYSRKKALQSQMRWRYDEDKEKTDWTEEKAAQEAGNLAKMLVQILWHLMENTRFKPHRNTKHQSKDEVFTAGQATNHADSAEASNAMKRLLKHFRDSINTNEWKEWMKRHKKESAVHALIEELEADTYENFVVEEISDYEDETDEEEDTEEYTFKDETQQRREVQRTELEENRTSRKQQRHEVQKVQTEAGKQIEEANKDLDELRQMLTSDTAAGGDVMAAIMEQPVSIVEFFQKRDENGELQECPDGKGWEKRNIEDIMDLIDEEWAKKIKKACRDKVENDNNVEVEDEHRINRMAAYMMMVDTTSISDEPKNVKLLFEYILLREPFYNINPNNPPRFVGESFDYVRMKPGESSISHQERRIPPSALKPVLDQIKEWMQQGVVEKSNSPHSSPLLLVKKKALSPPLMADGKPDPNYVAKVRWRTCVDYVQLNNKSAATDISNAPRVDELLDYIGLAGSHKEKKPGDEYWVSTVDLYAGFNQWYLSDEVRPLTAFTVPGLAAEEGRLQFRVLPFGLASAPTRFNSLVAETLAELRFGHHKANQANEEGEVVRACCTNYIDDVFVADICTFEQHLQDMDRVFERLQKAGFGARMDKAEFCRHEISMLGWTIAEGYKSAQEAKIKKIEEMLDVCSDVKDVLSLLGTVGFYRQLIPMSGDIEAPLYDLTKKGAWSENAWTPIHTACVKLLKYHLKEQVKLAIPRIGKDATGKEYPPMQLATDASQYAGGAVLFQEQADGVERPICFASKTFTKEQRNWSATERELWTLQYFATEHFRQFFIGGTPILYTDHKPLTYLFKNRNTTNAKIARWSAKLSKLRAIVEYRAGAKMGPADTFSRMMKDRPERGRRDLETPENREPMCNHRGPLQEFEPEDTKERTISLPREAGIPQQRVTFLKGSRTAKQVVSEETSEAQHELVQHGSIVSEEVVNRMEPLQKERIEVLRKAAEEHGYKPEFRVALAFDVTKVEEGIPSEADRVEKSRKHREQIETEEEAGMFPNTAVVWTTIARKHMSNIFTEATGEYVKDEEEEYICSVEKMRDEPAEYINKLEGIPKNQFVAMQGNVPGSGYTHEIQCVRDNIFAGMNELRDEREGGRIKRMLGEHKEQTFMGETDRWSMEEGKWENDSDYDEPDEDEVRKNEVCRVMGENTRALTDNQQMKKLGQSPQVMGEDAKEASPLSGEPNFEGWKEVERKIIDVTKKRLADLSPTNDDTLSESQKEFINALCDPKVSIVVCQGAAGCGKTYTAMLTACLAIEAGLLKNVKQTKPLVSTGGVGLGFERGEMADKLKYWCAPAREAMERIQMSEENRKKVEAFPIDRTRGISVPAHEQMIFDEMQNAPKSLWDAAMTRAEEYGKVVLCGDINQIDATNTKTLGMKRFLESWDGGLKEKLAKIEAEVGKLQEQVDKATESNKAQAEKKLKDKKYEMRPLAKAFEGFEIMRRSTRVINLGDSRALRSKSSGCITSFLNVCKVEQEEIRGKDLQVMGEDALTKASQNAREAEVDRITRREICQVDTSVVDETSCDTWHKAPRNTITEKLADREMQEWAKDVVRGADAQIRQSILLTQAVKKRDMTITARNSKQEINQSEGPKRPHTTVQQAPIFASFAGMDLLGMGLTRTFKAGKCVGGSECNNSARLLFRREHGFEPFRDHEHVPSYAYKHIFMVTTGAPCVAFSKAGLQRGQSDRRGCYYVSQVDAYIQAEVPVILFEQVREAREILRGDSVANGRKMSPQDQLVEKLEEAGYVVPKGPDGKAGFVMNAANQGSVLDRSRLFTLAVRKELYDKSMKNKEFKWPEDKAKNTRSIGEIFREPVEPSHLASAHVMEGFKRKQWETKTGVQYKLSKGQGIGEWYNANTVIGEEGKGLSITAMGNSRWVEFIDIDGKTQWRRLSGVETARAFGIKENELRKFQHLNDQEIHAAVGNGVCIEMGEAMGKVVEQFWDPEWFQAQCTEKAKGEDIFCLEGGTVDTKYEDSKKVIISQMSQEEQTEVQEIQTKGYEMAGSKATKNPHAECNRADAEKKHKSIKSKEQEDNHVRKIRRGEEDMLSKARLKDKFARALQHERMMFRRRVKKAIEGTRNVNEIEWDVEISKAAADGSAGIWDGAEVFRNESKDLKGHDFLWKGKTTSNYEEVNPTVPNIRDSNCKDLAKAQKKDPRYRNLIKFMEGTLQEKETSKVDTAELKKESDRYCFVDGILCRITSSERTGSTVRVCVPSSYQDELMRMCHDNPWTCHPTTDQMFRMLGLRYYWPQMRMSCAMYADTCDTCQRTGYPPKRGAGGRQYIPTSSPFACVAIDIVGPIGNKDSVTEKGNRYIVTMIDWFTRWIEAYSVKDQSEKSIIEALEHFTSRHGIPRRLVSDNAKYFRSKLIHQWEKDNGLKHTFVSAYRPQGNGKLERFHRVLGRKVKQQCWDAGDEQWDRHLEKITFAHNVVPHSTTGYSPFELVHGRLPVVPFDTLMPPTEEDTSVSHGAYMDIIRKRTTTAWQIAYENMSDKQTESTNLVAAENVRIQNYRAGDSIMLWVPSIPKGKSKKITCKWHGPYSVSEVNKGKQVTITMPDGHGAMKDRSVHQARVKRFKERGKEMATNIQSEEVFEWLERHEVDVVEGKSKTTGLDLLKRAPAREHIVGGKSRDEERWEQLWDGTERVGEIAGQADGTIDPEVPIPMEEKSPFDGQQLIEQTILDLTQNDNLLLKRCHECDKAQHAWHSCETCFEMAVNKTLTESTHAEMHYPMFREVKQDIENPNETEEASCDTCKCAIWIPSQYCQCGDEEKQMEGHTDIMTGEPIPATECPVCPEMYEAGEQGIEMKFNMGYPVIVQDGEVRPRVYSGKTALPPEKKGQLWQQVVKIVDSESEPESDEEEITHGEKATEGEAMEDQIYEAKSIIEYDEWEWKYEVTWKGYSHTDTTAQGVQDLVAAEGLVEEYWADPDTGVKKWKKLRPGLDNMKQTMEMLKSSKQMEMADIKVAGVQLCQAIGKSDTHIYNRLKAQEIRSTDVFNVILDVGVTKLLNTKKEKKKLAMEGKRKLIIPVKWTWSRLYKVCTPSEIKKIRSGLASAAKERRHTHWAKSYKEMPTMGGTEKPNKEEFVVVKKEAMIKQIERVINQVTQQQTSKWQTQEQRMQNQANANEFQTQMQAFMSEQYDATDECKPELESEEEQVHETSLQVPALCASAQELTEILEQQKVQIEDEVQDTVQEAKSSTEKWDPAQNGGFVKFWQDQDETEVCNMEVQAEVQVVKAEQESEVRAMQYFTQKQQQSITTAFNMLRKWGCGRLKGKWLECPHGAVRMEGHQKRPYGFIMQDKSPMPRCKIPECLERIVKGQRWIHQVNHQINQTSGNQVCQVENETIHFKQRMQTQMIREIKSSEQVDIVDNESTLHQTEEFKELQDPQQEQDMNEVKRVIKINQVGNVELDTTGQEILDKIFKDTVDRHIELRNRTEVNMEAKKKEFMLRHWECNTKAEEMELKSQEMKLMQEQEKHEIEMQERRNEMNRQQEEHKRRMSSNLW